MMRDEMRLMLENNATPPSSKSVCRADRCKPGLGSMNDNYDARNFSICKTDANSYSVWHNHGFI
jgi:hypothetical protein